MAFDYQGAINEGYSDDEIIDHLAKSNKNFDVQGARAEGYSVQEIADHLSKGDPEKIASLQNAPFLGAERTAAQSAQEWMQLQKGAISGATLGASEFIPGLQSDESSEFEAGKFLGSFLPLGGAVKYIAQPIAKATAQLAMKSPYAQRTLAYLGKLVGYGTAGVAVETTEKAFKGDIPTAEDLATHGLLWAGLEAGLDTLGFAGRFAKNVVQRTKATGESSTEIMRRMAERLQKLGYTQETLQAGDQKAFDAAFEILNDYKPAKIAPKDIKATDIAKPLEVAKPSAPEITAKSLVEEEAAAAQKLSAQEQQAAKDAKATKILDEFHPAEPSEEAFGKALQEGVESQAALAKEAERQLYAPARAAAEDIPANTASASSAADAALERIGSLKTKPQGYNAVHANLKQIIDDLGSGLSTSKLMDLGVRLNEIIVYDLIDPTVKDLLKPVKVAVKNDIRTSLKKRPGALKKFIEAEKLHGANEEKFGNKIIQDLRTKERPEKIQSLLSNPTDFRLAKSASGTGSEKALERSALEQISRMTPDKAARTIANLKPYLSKEAKKAADAIAENLKPSVQEAVKKAIDPLKSLKGIIKDDMLAAQHYGDRPERLLKLWRTPHGRRQIKAASGTDSKAVSEYLSRQTLADFSASVTKPSGGIDFAKVKKLLENPLVKQDILAATGPEGLKFLQDLERISNGVQDNFRMLQKMQGAFEGSTETGALRLAQGKERLAAGKKAAEAEAKRAIELDKAPITGKLREWVDELGIPSKVLLAGAGLLKPILIPPYLLLRFAESKGIREAAYKAAEKGISPAVFVTTMNSLEEAYDEK